MLEDSVENVVLQWKTYAATVKIYPKTEGSPLLECFANNQVFYLFERTSPYESSVGTRQVIINPVAKHLQLTNETKKEINTIDISALEATGLIIYRGKHMVVVDAGLPLVVGYTEPLPDEIVTGEWLELTTIRPIHGFVVPMVRQGRYFERNEEI